MFKRPRRFNRGKLRLQSAFMHGRSLPQETSTHVFWRGSGTVDLRAQKGTQGLIDTTFCLNTLNGPTVKYSGPSIHPPTDAVSKLRQMTNLRGSYSYRDVWASLYSQYMVTGARISIRLTRPLYPSILKNPGRGSLVDAQSSDVNNTNCMMTGFWYLRYHYVRSLIDPKKPVESGAVVGHPMLAHESALGASDLPEVHNWSSIRDFMQDPTVLWFRDKLPKATKVHYTTSSVSMNNAANNNLIPDTNLFPEGFQGRPNDTMSYEVEYSNRAVKLIGAFSLRKHSDDKNMLRNGDWMPMSYPGVDKDRRAPLGLQSMVTLRTNGFPDASAPFTEAGFVNTYPFFVRFGYIGFDQTGTPLTCIPPDNIPQRNIEVSCDYKVRLRSPKVEPWTPGITYFEEKDAFMGRRATTDAPDLTNSLLLTQYDDVEDNDDDELILDDDGIEN